MQIGAASMTPASCRCFFLSNIKLGRKIVGDCGLQQDMYPTQLNVGIHDPPVSEESSYT